MENGNYFKTPLPRETQIPCTGTCIIDCHLVILYQTFVVSRGGGIYLQTKTRRKYSFFNHLQLRLYYEK